MPCPGALIRFAGGEDRPGAQISHILSTPIVRRRPAREFTRRALDRCVAGRASFLVCRAYCLALPSPWRLSSRRCLAGN